MCTGLNILLLRDDFATKQSKKHESSTFFIILYNYNKYDTPCEMHSNDQNSNNKLYNKINANHQHSRIDLFNIVSW